MPARNAPLSLNQRVIDLANQLRRLRIPPKPHSYTKVGPISVASGVVPLHNDTGLVLAVSSVRAMVGTAPSTDDVTIDVTVGGTSIFDGTTFPTVSVGATVGDPVVPTAGQWPPGAALLVDITQGDTDAADLHVTIVVA